MPKAPLLVGLDGGTEGLRVGIFDTSGTPLVFIRKPYATDFVKPGWAEQNPQDWWDAAVAGIGEAMAAIGASGSDIAAISVGGTSCTVVCLDSSGTVLRPAIIWMDVRADEETRQIAATGSPSLKLSGTHHASAEWLPSKALWLKKNQPEIWDATSWMTEYTDYLTWRLSGEKVGCLNTAAIRAYYDAENGGWAHELYSAVGMPDLIHKLPTEVVPMGARVGGLSPEAQKALGLPASVAVVMGGADAFVAQVGLGVVNPGSMALITGSSHLMLLQSDTRVHGEGTFGAYPDAVIQGQYTLEGGQTSSGSIISWFRRLIDSEDVSTDFFEQLTPKAEKLPPGSNGLLVLDHFQGNRTPYVDAKSRGALLGLTLQHQPEHIFRAMMESVCFGTENTMRRFREQGHSIDSVVVSGGAVNSPLWLQLHSDISGMALGVPKVAESATLGPAILAAVGAGIYSTIEQAAEEMVELDYTVEPSMSNHEAYEPLFDLYQRSYQQLKPLLHSLAEMQG
jgi:ribulokinase